MLLQFNAPLAVPCSPYITKKKSPHKCRIITIIIQIITVLVDSDGKAEEQMEERAMPL